MDCSFSMKKVLFFLVVPALFLSCEINIDGDYFDYDLRGTWVSINSNPPYYYTYNNKLEISMDTIKITTYSYSVPALGGFTCGYLLEGYSEKLSEASYREHSGNLLIKDMGSWRSVPYLLWKEAGYTGRVLLTIGDSPGRTTFEKQ
jgi:hypothetical protein